MARPPKEIDWNEVEKRMEAGNSAMQIATHFRIQVDTFYRRFKDQFGSGFQDYHAIYSQCGISNIEYAQYTKALEGNVQMLIHLGKVRCKQVEHGDEKPGTSNITIITNHDLASGSNVPTQRLPESSNQSTQ